MNKELEKLISRNSILEQTKNCIEIEELLAGLDGEILDSEMLKSMHQECMVANNNLWGYLTRLAEVQSIHLPEYEG